jgi:hypothetical protein
LTGKSGEICKARYIGFKLELTRAQSEMNRIERRPIAADEAKLEYLNGEFRVLSPGSFVRCAVTGVPIKLEDLRYWNVDLQEPYAGPQAKLQRLGIMPAPFAPIGADGNFAGAE